jgi:uncharacterized protein involved in cysteine biosynthesis
MSLVASRPLDLNILATASGILLGLAWKVVSYFFSQIIVHISGLFNDAVNSLVYTASNGKKIKGIINWKGLVRKL